MPIDEVMTTGQPRLHSPALAVSIFKNALLPWTVAASVPLAAEKRKTALCGIAACGWLRRESVLVDQRAIPSRQIVDFGQHE